MRNNLKLSTIFDHLRVFENLYLNLPDGYEFLGEELNPSDSKTAQEFARKVYEYLPELKEIKFFDYSKEEYTQIEIVLKNPKLLNACIDKFVTPKEIAKFDRFINR